MPNSLGKCGYNTNPDRLMLVGLWCCLVLIPVFISSPASAGLPAIHPFLDAEESSALVEPRSYSQVSAEFLLRDQVEVSRDRIFLDDVAACTAPDDFCTETAAIDLGFAPGAGKSIRLTKTSIGELLKREWPGAQISLRGAEIIKVFSPAVDVDKIQLQRQLSVALDGLNSSNEGIRLKVERMQVIAPTKVRPGYSRYYFPEIAEMPEGLLSRVMRHNGGSVSLEVSLLSDEPNSPPQNVSISAQLVVERLVVVAASDITLGTILGESDLKLDWVVFKTQGYRAFTSLEPLIGQRAKRSVFMQNPIDGSAVETPALVSRGELVGMKIRASGLEVSARVEALGTGASGDIIDVMNKETKKKLRAKIVSRNQVEAI